MDLLSVLCFEIPDMAEIIITVETQFRSKNQRQNSPWLHFERTQTNLMIISFTEFFLGATHETCGRNMKCMEQFKIQVKENRSRFTTAPK